MAGRADTPRRDARGRAIVSDASLDELMALAGTAPDNKAARRWLRDALDSIPPLIAAKAKKRAQGLRNAELDAVAETSKKLRQAYAALDWATRAAVYDESLRRNGPASDHPVSALLREDMTNGRVVATLLQELEEAVKTAKQDTKDGPMFDEGADEVAKLLIGFVRGYGKCKLSAKRESRFDRFARRAHEIATGEDRSLRESIARVLADSAAKKGTGN
jgi:hypothetical protein